MISNVSWLPTDPAFLYLLQLQGLISFVVLLAWGIDRMLGRSRPALRCGVWETALLGILLAPLFCWVAPRLPWRIIDLSPNVAEVPPQVANKADPIKVVPPPLEEKPKEMLGLDPQFRALSQNVSSEKIEPKPMQASPVALEEPVATQNESSAPLFIGTGALYAIWAAGSLFLLARLIHGFLKIRSALGGACALVPFEDSQLLDEVRKRMGLAELPAINLANGVRGPLVFGFLRPRVILPAAIREQVTREQMIDILIHECAHVRRRDGLIRLFQHGALVLFWINPLVWLLNRKLDWAREEVCDNFVLKHTAAPDYAGTLLSIAERCFPVKENPGLLAMMANGSGLELRVIDLLDTARDPSTQVSRKHKSALWLLLILVLALLSAVGIQAGPRRENPLENPSATQAGQPDADLARESTAQGQAGTDQNAAMMKSGTTGSPQSNAALAQADPVQALPGRDEPKPDPVKESIERAVRFLRDQQHQDNWEVDGESSVRKGGWSSLALLALLNAGVPVDDPAIQRGLSFQRKIEPEQTYAVSLQTCVFAFAGLAEDQPLVQRNLKWLMSHKVPSRPNRIGGWDYGAGTGTPDSSNTQFAHMALHDGYWFLKSKNDIRLDEEFLTGMRQCQGDLISLQHQDGGWSYRNEQFTSFTMTTAGLANLNSLASAVNRRATNLAPDGAEENCGVYEENSALLKARRWLGDSFPKRIPATAVAKSLLNHPYYALHAVQRAGKFTGQRFFHEHDWFQIGCDFLLKSQQANGSWGGAAESSGGLDNWPVVATSFAVLFLSRGRTPVLVSKLAHHGERSWNRKHRDLMHLVPFVSKEIFEGKSLAWQVFDTSKIPLDRPEHLEHGTRHLLESPVVWLSGHNEVPEGDSRRLLKSYLDRGGFLFAEACCASPDFDRNFRKMIKDLYPGLELTPLPAEHPVWSASGKRLVQADRFPLYGIVQDGKAKIIYSPKAISGYWEGNVQVEGPGVDAFRLGANVIAYATNKKMPLPRLSRALAAQP